MSQVWRMEIELEERLVEPRWPAGIKVQAANPTGAARLYERVGMQVVERTSRPRQLPSGWRWLHAREGGEDRRAVA